MLDILIKQFGLNEENSGLNEENFNLLMNVISSSGVSMIITVAGGLLYLLGQSISCLSCGPVRVIILSLIAFAANLATIYQKCEPKLDNDTIVKIVKEALISTAVFMIGYTIVPWMLPLPVRLFTWFGPGKTIVPAIIGSLLMITFNSIFPQFKIIDQVCK